MESIKKYIVIGILQGMLVFGSYVFAMEQQETFEGENKASERAAKEKEWLRIWENGGAATFALGENSEAADWAFAKILKEEDAYSRAVMQKWRQMTAEAEKKE